GRMPDVLFHEAVELLACPRCGGALRGRALSCTGCGAAYQVRGRIPDLRIESDARTEAVREFYTQAPFPAYPPRDSPGWLRARGVLRSTWSTRAACSTTPLTRAHRSRRLRACCVRAGLSWSVCTTPTRACRTGCAARSRASPASAGSRSTRCCENDARNLRAV